MHCCSNITSQIAKIYWVTELTHNSCLLTINVASQKRFFLRNTEFLRPKYRLLRVHSIAI